jgi:uracil-DNA glycosylase family protein
MTTDRESRTTPRSAAQFLPKGGGLSELRSAAEHCRGCDLYRDAIQTVFGAGSAGGAVVMIGEQPGDVEDKQGTPFVGPAGKLLRRAIEDSGLDPAEVYLTNAVKHFRFKSTEGSVRRIHQKPSYGQVQACFPWLVHEIDLIKPEVLVVLGSTAGQALFGREFKVTTARGEFVDWHPETPAGARPIRCLITVHPSAVLRARGGQGQQDYADFVLDLRRVAETLNGSAGERTPIGTGGQVSDKSTTSAR